LRHDWPVNVQRQFRIFEALSAKSPQSLHRIGSFHYLGHQNAAGEKGSDHAIGRSRGGLSTKINAVVELGP